MAKIKKCSYCGKTEDLKPYKDIYFCKECMSVIRKAMQDPKNRKALADAQHKDIMDMENAFEKWALEN